MVFYVMLIVYFFFFKQKTAYDMRISDWSSDVCSSDLPRRTGTPVRAGPWGRGARQSHARARLRVRPDARRRQLARLAGDAGWALCLTPEASRAVEIGRASCRERVCQYV